MAYTGNKTNRPHNTEEQEKRKIMHGTTVSTGLESLSISLAFAPENRQVQTGKINYEQCASKNYNIQYH